MTKYETKAKRLCLLNACSMEQSTFGLPSGIQVIAANTSSPKWVANGRLLIGRCHERYQEGQKESATVLDRKDKIRVFEEVVGENDELSHKGGESEFFGFATIEEAEVERSEDRVVAGGDERGHVKDRAEL